MNVEETLTPDQERDCLAKARAGDGEAFGLLVRAHMKKIYALAYHMVGNAADADDVAQGAFIKAHESIERFETKASFGTWMYRITVNHALDHLRRRKHRLNFSGVSPEDGPALDPVAPDQADGPAEERDLRRRLRAGLDRLAGEIRAAVILVYIDDFSPREAAQRLGCAEATVHWRLFRARQQLRKYFQEVPL